MINNFQGKKSRASSSDSSGDEKKGRGRDKAREKVSSNYYIFLVFGILVVHLGFLDCGFGIILDGVVRVPSHIAVAGQEEEEGEQLEFELKQRLEFGLKFEFV